MSEMNRGQTSQEKELFQEAVELPPSERAKFLDDRCAGNPQLRKSVESLLEAHKLAGDFLSGPTLNGASGRAGGDGETFPQRIGAYRLVELLGEGGFGSVYVAEQDSPIRRRVALKIVKPGMDTRQVIARFEAERQALAMMDHPNIARVYDAGATDAGRPYFVMELVTGDPITRYCDSRRLSPRERLELFISVCGAIQHAHQKGVIHRDLKPSNVLVTTVDGAAVAKVIDFGIAKAIDVRLAASTLVTDVRQLMGTPEYMSPEQAEGTGVDTRSDIYSLGVLLYELLTGTTPFSGRELRSKGYAEVQRVLRDVDPPKPSTRVSMLTDELPTIAAQRRLEPRQLQSTLRGDLDWIVVKCLEKPLARRYDSAAALSADILRFLQNKPVSAGPPGAVYRVKKFVSRHRLGVIAAACVALALICGLGFALVGLRQAQAERDRAELARRDEQAARQSAQDARALAEARLEVARAAVDTYLNRITEDPRLRQADLVGLRRALLEAAIPLYVRLSDIAPGQTVHVDQGSAMYRLGTIRRQLGDLSGAARDLNATAELARLQISRSDDVTSWWDVLSDALHELGGVSREAGDLRSAEAALVEARDVRQALLEAEPDSPTRLGKLADSLNSLGLVNLAKGERASAAKSFRAVAELRERIRRIEPGDLRNLSNLSTALNNSGNLHLEFGDHAAAIKEFEYAIALGEQVLAADPQDPGYRNALARPLTNLGNSYADVERWDEAKRVYLDAIRIRRQLVSEFPSTPRYRSELTTTLNNLATVYKALKEFDQAMETYTETLETLRQLIALVPSNLEYRNFEGELLGNLASLEYSRGRFDEARRKAQEGVELCREIVRAHPGSAPGKVALARNLATMGFAMGKSAQAQEGLEPLNEALALLEELAVQSPESLSITRFRAEAQLQLANTLMALHRSEEALAAIEKSEHLAAGVLARSPLDAAANQFRRDAKALREAIAASATRPADAVPHYAN